MKLQKDVNLGLMMNRIFCFVCCTVPSYAGYTSYLVLYSLWSEAERAGEKDRFSVQSKVFYFR